MRKIFTTILAALTLGWQMGGSAQSTQNISNAAHTR